MGDLVPEKRMDKNGVLTTKHVRALPKSVGTKPTLPKVDDTDARALKVFDSIRNRRGSISGSLVNEVQREIEARKASVPVMGRTILTLHPKTLDRLEAFNYTVLNGITRNIGIGIKERSFNRLNNFAVLRQDCGDVSETIASLLIGGLNAHRGRSAWLDYADATEDDLASPRAVLRAAMALNPEFVVTDEFAECPTRFIRSATLVELIESRPQDVDRIVAIVNERAPILDESGINGINQILDAGTHDAVLNGTL